MGKTLYARCQKITDCVGRENYITSPDRQETLIHSYSNVGNDYWQKLQVETEPGVNDCREIHFMLPNNLKGNQEMIEKYVNQIADEFHNKYHVDFVIGCHDNEENLHCHLMFNERECINPGATQELSSKMVQARYKVDDKYVTKKVYTQAELEGGHICEYIPKHEVAFISDKMFSNKIKHFKDKEFLEEFKQDLALTMNEIEQELGTDLIWQRELQEGHLAQVHVGKNVTAEIKAARESYNEYVKEHNRLYDLSLPELRNLALDKLHNMYNEVISLAESIKQQLQSTVEMVKQGTVLAQLGKMFDEGENLVNQANQVKKSQLEVIRNIGKTLDKGEELVERADGIEREIERSITRTREVEGHSR